MNQSFPSIVWMVQELYFTRKVCLILPEEHDSNQRRASNGQTVAGFPQEGV